MQIWQKVRQCENCRVFDPDNQPSVRARLSKGNWKPIIYTLANGMYLEFDGVRLPLHTDYIICDEHRIELETFHTKMRMKSD